MEVEYLHRVSWRYLEHTECSGVWNIQGGRVDKDRDLCPVVKPDPGLVTTEKNSCKDIKLAGMISSGCLLLTKTNLVSGSHCRLGSSEIAGPEGGQVEEVHARLGPGLGEGGDL